MKKPIFLILTIFLLSGITSYAQTNIWDENPSDSQIELDSLLNILPYSSSTDRLRLLNRVAEIYWSIDPNKTIDYGDEALRLSRELNDKRQEGLALINLCQGYLFNDFYDRALQYGLQSLEIRKDLNNDYDLAFTLRTLGWLYFDIGYFDKALEYHTETLKIHEKIGDRQRIAYSYNSIGLIHERSGDCKLALSFFKKSLELKKVFNNKDRISETMKNMGVCYRKINELVAAKTYLESSLEISNQINDIQNKVHVLNELSLVNLKLGDFDKCYALVNESRSIMEGLMDNKEWIVENDRIMSEYFLAKQDYKEAFNYYKKYAEGNSEIFSSNKSEKLTDMRIRYEDERRASQIKLLEQQRNLEAQRKRSILIGSLLLTIIGILIIASLWNNIRKKKAIYQQSDKLAREKLKTQSLLRENLEHKLEFRMKELTNMALFISQRTSIYRDLTKSLKTINSTDINQLKKDINRLIREYSYKFDFNEDLQKFHANIETLQSDFLFRIKENYPHLTDKDIKLAVQVKLKLSSKEIANINNISINSVEIGRHRLRKKLSIDSKESLVRFLENI